MTKTISRLLLLLTIFAVSFTSCSDEYPNYNGTVTFERSGIFVENWGESQTSTFSLDNVAYVELDYDDADWTEGWKVDFNFYKGTITVTAPDEPIFEDGEIVNQFCTLEFSGETHDGYSVYASLSLGVVDFIYLNDEQSNSMIVTQPGKLYIFDPSYKGEDPSQTIDGMYDCKLLWRSYPSSIQYVQMLNSNEVAFYLKYDEYDLDEDGDKTDALNGSAVIAAQNSSGEALWSWHIWVLDEYPSEVSFNDKLFMDRNLGADINSVESDTTVLYSYGLYYQWGRKDPVIQPYFYNAAGSYDGIMYDINSNGVSLVYEESTSSIGELSYAIKNPLTYITGVEESNYDWLYDDHNDELWSDSKKSIYDPSPKGWRVPRSTDFEGVTIESIPPAGTDSDASYGGYLSDGSTLELFMGLGRRNYITGRIGNVNSNYNNTAPWTGYYWTSGAASEETRAVCFKFDNNDLIDAQHEALRANGMQIRCVRDN